MTAPRLDAIARRFAERRKARRQATAAAEGTPLSVPPVDPPEKIPYLFVQSFQGGSLTSTGDPDRHTLTLEGGLGQTVYFADRPSRDVGITPTPQFLQTLGFSKENPPNAALLVDAGDGETDLTVVELFDPSYDAATHTATYQVRGLEAWEASEDAGFQNVPADLSTLVGPLGTSHLFIDDCSIGSVICGNMEIFMPPQYLPPMPYCYTDGYCLPCEPYHGQPPRGLCDVFQYWADTCNEMFPGICVGQCKPLFEPDTLGLCDG